MDDKTKAGATDPRDARQHAGDHQPLEATEDSLAALREQRMFEYLAKVLNMEDSLSANVGAVNADLMLFAGHMRRIIAPALKELPAEPASLANLVPAMEWHGRMARQIERLATLMDRLNREQDPGKQAAMVSVTAADEKPAEN